MIILHIYALSVASPTADPGVVSSIPAHPQTFVEIDQEIISPYADSRRCMKYWLSAAQEKVWLGELTIST